MRIEGESVDCFHGADHECNLFPLPLSCHSRGLVAGRPFHDATFMVQDVQDAQLLSLHFLLHRRVQGSNIVIAIRICTNGDLDLGWRDFTLWVFWMKRREMALMKWTGSKRLYGQRLD